MERCDFSFILNLNSWENAPSFEFLTGASAPHCKNTFMFSEEEKENIGRGIVKACETTALLHWVRVASAGPHLCGEAVLLTPGKAKGTTE
jgi:hypothetical protein